MKLPSCMKKVESPAPQKCELGEEMITQESTTPCESTAGPSSTECPTPKPRTMIEAQKDTTTSTNNCSVSKPEEPQQPSEKKSIDDARLCKICYNEELGVVFVPCGHIVTCVKCAPGMTTCAVCRKKVELTVRAFFS